MFTDDTLALALGLGCGAVICGSCYAIGWMADLVISTIARLTRFEDR
jgi:F0F1-type ATP synthase membrane subunit c/vacuolar-type H+-ATPase subunit K